jgi:hypothetical protein
LNKGSPLTSQCPEFTPSRRENHISRFPSTTSVKKGRNARLTFIQSFNATKIGGAMDDPDTDIKTVLVSEEMLMITL